MKLRILGTINALLCFALIAASCGGGASSIVGPVLDISEMTSLKIDQFYVASGLEDEYADIGEFAVYLRDEVTGKDLACAGQEQGMNKLGRIETYYGNLDMNLREVDGDHPGSSARFQLVFVEKDGPDCPNAIASGDDIIGISAPFSAEDLLEGNIWAANGKAVAKLRVGSTASETPAPMAPAMEDALIVDQIGFQNDGDGETEHTYYLFAERYEGDQAVELCEIADEDMESVRFGNMIYAAMNIKVPCFTSDSADFGSMQIKFSLFIQKDDGPQSIGATEITRVADMIGETLDFTNGMGYIRLRNVATEAFSSRTARLEELARLTLTSLDYTIAPAATEQVEVHLRSPDGYSVVCTGPDQGLTAFVAIEDQEELFGWEELDLVVLGRSDGKSCPAPLDSPDTFTVLGQTTGLEPLELDTGSANFSEGGSATWTYTSI